MALPICTSSQKPYVVGNYNGTGLAGGGTGLPSDSPGEACAKYNASVTGVTYAAGGRVNEHECVASFSGAVTVPIIKVCTPEPLEMSSQKIADLNSMWSIFLGAAIVIVLLRKLYQIFDRSPHGE